MKNEFLGMAAHDLRNPLGVIYTYSSYLLECGNLPPPQHKIIKHMFDSSNFMKCLINDLLEISSIESGNINIQLEKQDYISFVKNNVELNKILAVTKKIDLVIECSEERIELMFDKLKIEQVLNNLISNAIKYSNPETKTVVRIIKNEKYVLTEIIDQGLGIPTDELSKVFKAFQKTSVKATAGEKSTGLGLSIVKRIILAHNGDIDVKSEVGKGSNFYFTLPLE